jgi:hypothetical protein
MRGDVLHDVEFNIISRESRCHKRSKHNAEKCAFHGNRHFLIRCIRQASLRSSKTDSTRFLSLLSGSESTYVTPATTRQ